VALPDATSGADGLFRAPPLESVRVAFVGVGHQGISHGSNFLRIDGGEITASCEIRPERVAMAQKLVTAAGGRRPAGGGGGEHGCRRLCDSNDSDPVVAAAPWPLHPGGRLAAMEAGRPAATEVPMAVTVAGLWQMVEKSESSQRHCVMMQH